MNTSTKYLAGTCLGLLAVLGTARAASPDAIATTAGCMTCHTVAKKVLGPAFHDVAARYKGDAAAPASLAAKVRAGSKGSWGPVPMPPTDAKKISDADLGAVIAWVLKQ